MPSQENGAPTEGSPTPPQSDPVDLQPYPIVIALTPEQWNTLYETLYSYYTRFASSKEWGGLRPILQEVHKALINNGLRKP